MTSHHITFEEHLELVVPVKTSTDQPAGYLVGKFSKAALEGILYARQVCVEMGVLSISCGHELSQVLSLNELPAASCTRILLNATDEEQCWVNRTTAKAVAPGVIVQANVFYLTSNTGDWGRCDTISDAIPITHDYYSKTVGFEEITPAELRAFLIESDGLAVNHGETV